MAEQVKEPHNEHKVVRRFAISDLAVDNRTSVFVLIILIAIMGATAYINMPKEQFPEVNIPTIYVNTPYPGNAPLDMENLITRPIEKELNSITGVDKITSTSVQDYSSIEIEFDFSTDVDEALLDVKDAVDKSKSELPNDLDDDPNTFKVDFAEIPIMNINVYGENYDMDDLKYYAELLEERIENLPQISDVELRGALEKEVKIIINRFKMESLQLSFRDVEDAIAYENTTMAGGDLLTDEYRRTIRVIGEFKGMDEIGGVIVKNDFQKVVYLRDIADIEFGYVEANSYARAEGHDVITLDIKKRNGENLLDAADAIKEILAEVNEGDLIPKDLTVEIFNDTSRFTRSQVENLENSIISGIILVVLVLLFFLGLRNSLFVGVAIPLSMLTGFLILGIMDVSMNVVVLFSLILALGMLVDNGIVVVENVYRLMQEGYSPIRAAKEGVGEVAWPIIASTATTLAAFLPLLFWDSIMGEFMKFLPITLMIVLSSSLFVALVINPVLTAVFMKVQEKGKKKLNHFRILIAMGILIVLGVVIHLATIGKPSTAATFAGNLFILVAIISLVNIYILSPLSVRFQEVFLPRVERLYDRTIAFALRGKNPIWTLVGMVLLFIFSIMLLGARQPNVVQFPQADPNYINVFIELPTGTDIEETNAYTQEIEAEIFEAMEPYIQNGTIEAILTNVGEGTIDPNSGEMPMGNTPNRSKITISFVEYQDRTLPEDFTTNTLLDQIRDITDQYAKANITVAQDPNGPPTGPPISIEIAGEEYTTLIDIANDVKAKIDNSRITGIEELKSNLDDSKPELIVDINRDAAQRYGLSTMQIAGTIRTALFGKEVSQYKEGEDEYPIMLRLQDEQRYNLDDLMNQRITFMDQQSGSINQVPISAVANVEYSTTYASVIRKDLDRTITLFSNLETGANAAAIIEEVSELLSDYNLPEGYTIKYTGEIEEQQESMAFLGVAFGIAIALILFIIIAQFNSISAPVIIMLSVLFSTIGVFLGLAITGDDFVVMMTGIGIISLAGVVVNNAIVLIDYTNLVRTRRKKELGMDEDGRLSREDLIEVIKEGGRTRLRPVLLTAVTTVLGLVPLAMGFNINFFTLMDRFDPQIFIGGDNTVFWGPMSKTIIYGLIFSTFLTLVVVPVMYLLADRAKTRVKGWMSK